MSFIGAACMSHSFTTEVRPMIDTVIALGAPINRPRKAAVGQN